MHDRELVETVVGAARMTLPMIVGGVDDPPTDGVDPTDIEASRRLVRILETGGTDAQALGWTAEILEVTAKVMTRHRLAIPPEARQAWAQVSLLFRSAGLAFAEAVGRVPGTATTLEVDVLDVTRSACLALSSELDHAGVRTLIASLDQVSGHLHRIDGLAPFLSEDVERVAVALRPVSQHRNDD